MAEEKEEKKGFFQPAGGRTVEDERQHCVRHRLYFQRIFQH